MRTLVIHFGMPEIRMMQKNPGGFISRGSQIVKHWELAGMILIDSVGCCCTSTIAETNLLRVPWLQFMLSADLQYDPRPKLWLSEHHGIDMSQYELGDYEELGDDALFVIADQGRSNMAPDGVLCLKGPIGKLTGQLDIGETLVAQLRKRLELKQW